MPVECFLDTNILVYAAASDKNEAEKKARALELIDTVDFGLSAQVLQEFYVTVTKKFSPGMQPAKAMEWLEAFEVFPCLPVDAALVKLGCENSVRYKTSYWDGAILAAAQCLQAPLLYSEDLNDGQDYGGVIVRNPFR